MKLAGRQGPVRVVIRWRVAPGLAEVRHRCASEYHTGPVAAAQAAIEDDRAERLPGLERVRVKSGSPLPLECEVPPVSDVSTHNL